MIEAVFLFIVILILAAGVYYLLGWVGLPHPIPAIVAALLVLLAFWLLIANLVEEDELKSTLVLPLLTRLSSLGRR